MQLPGHSLKGKKTHAFYSSFLLSGKHPKVMAADRC